MAPTVRKPLTLGFIGQGVTSAKNAEALLTDLIGAEGGKARFILPATEDHWTEGIETVADYALENKIPLVLVTDDSTAGLKNLKGYTQQAAETVKVISAVTKVVKLTAESTGKLIMLWDDEDDDCYTALDLAEKENVEALDLTAGLHRLEFTGEAAETEPEEDEYTYPEPQDQHPDLDDLDDMDEEDLQTVADQYGIDVEAYDTWDEVRDLIRAARAGGTTSDEPGLPSTDEVLEWDFDTLKKFAQEHQVEVPPRSKTSGYRKAVTEFLASALAHLDAIDREAEALHMPQDDVTDIAVPADDVEPPTGAVTHDDVAAFLAAQQEWKEFLAGLQGDVEKVLKSMDAIGRSMTEHMIELRTLVMEVTKPGTIQAAQQKATEAAQAGQAEQAAEKSGTATKTVQRPAKAAEKPATKRKVNRPAPAPAATDEPKERPLAPFMHLLGKKLTKAQAKEIMIAATMRGRGRPTEDERTLIAAARELVPQV